MPTQYVPTVFDNYSKNATINGEEVQGDHSCCFKPSVNAKTEVAFLYVGLILKWNLCFDINGRFEST